MQPSGASVNDIQPKVILSLLQRATPPTEVIDTVVNATMDMATQNRLPWTREVELKCVNRRVDCDLKKLQDEYDYRTGEVPRWLAEEFHQKWADTLAKGGRPRLSRNRHNKHLFSVWAYGKEEGEETRGGKEETRGGKEPRCATSPVQAGAVLRPAPGHGRAALLDRRTDPGGWYRRGVGGAEMSQVVHDPRHDVTRQQGLGIS